MEQFKVGDVVVLKANGPKMTINVLGETLDGHNWVECKWFWDCILYSGRFAVEALKKIQ